MRGARNLHVKILGLAARQARFALAIGWRRKHVEHRRHKNQSDGT